MMLARAGLGLIPSWQFNMDPAVNPKVVNLAYPDGMYQTTVQPVGPYMNGGGGLGNAWAAGPGVRVFAPAAFGRCPAGTVETSRGCLTPGGALSSCPPGMVMTSRGCINPGTPLSGLRGVFDSWLWNNRIWVAAGAFGVVGAGLVVLLAKTLK